MNFKTILCLVIMSCITTTIKSQGNSSQIQKIPEGFNQELNKEKIKINTNVDFMNKSKKIELPADGLFLYSSLNNNGNFYLGYNVNENYVVTITNPTNEKIRVRTDYIALADKGEVLSFYDGADTLQPLMVSYTDFLLTNELIVSRSNSITIKFKSNATGINKGFKLRIDKANLKSYSLSSVLACLNGTPAADVCANAPVICNLNGYCGNTSGQYTADNTNITGFCGSIENNSWLSFIASGPTAQFEFTSGGCQDNNSGIQALIYASSNCSNFTQVSNCVSQGSGSGSFTITTNTALIPGTKYYIMVDGFGGNICNYSVTAQSGVATNPQITANPAQICPGKSTQLASSIVSTSYSWTASDGTILPNTQNITVSPTVTTTYTLQVGPSGCSPTGGSAVQTVSITNTLPAPNLSAPSGVCTGNNITLSSLTNGGTFIWTGPSGFTSAQQNPVILNFSPSNVGTYSLIIDYGGGCTTQQATLPVSALVGPNVGLTASPSNVICPGSQINLTASGGGETFFNQAVYNWSWIAAETSMTTSGCLLAICLSGNYPQGINATKDAVATPSVNTQICVSASSPNGCVSKACQNIIVLSNSVLNVSPSVTTCPTQPVMLTGSGTSTYTWQPGSLNGGTVSVNPSTTTIYTVTGTGCSAAILSNTVEVAVISNPPNLGAILTPSLVCPNETDVHYTVNNIANTTYNWTLPTGAVVTSTTSNTNDIVVNMGSATGTFTAAVTATNSCGATTETVTIQVAQITVTAVATPSAYCNPGSATITVGGGYWYDWQPTTNLSVSSGTNTTIIASPSITTNYTVTGNKGACINSTVITISVGNASGPLTVSPSVTTCPTGSVALTAGGASTFTWSPSTGVIGSVNNAVLNTQPATTTIYTVTAQGCTGISTNTVMVTVVNQIVVNATPNSTTICAGQTANFTASGASNYVWASPTATNIGTNATINVNPTINTTYTVTGKIGVCVNTAIVTVSVNAPSVFTVTASSNTICNGQSTTLTAAANGVTTFTWNNGLSTQNPFTVSPTTNTVYTVVGNSACAASGQINIIVNQSPVIGVNSPTACLNQPVVLIASGTATSYTWSGQTAGANATVMPTTNGQVYTVTATLNNCATTKTTSVFVNSPIASFTGIDVADPQVGTVITLTNTTTSASVFSWTKCNGDTSVNKPFLSFTLDTALCCIKLRVANSTCFDSVTKCISVPYFEIPNVFTPNGDNVNEKFKIKARGVTNLTCTIFNRWGIKLHEWSGADGFWDGGDAPTGTYFYIINYTDYKNESKKEKGPFSLFR